MNIFVGNKNFNINDIKSINYSNPNLLFINLKDGNGHCIILKKENCPASEYVKKIIKSFSMLTNKKLTSENNPSSTIYRVTLSPLEEIRYWYDDLGKMHIAVWNNGDCIVSDTEKTADTFKNIVKYILNLKEKNNENE